MIFKYHSYYGTYVCVIFILLIGLITKKILGLYELYFFSRMQISFKNIEI